MLGNVMMLLRDRPIITFKEIDIILNRMFRTALRRARNYVTSDFAIRGGYRIIIFIFPFVLNFQYRMVLLRVR